MEDIGKINFFKKTLKKNERIKKKKEIKEIFKNGKKIVCPNYNIIYKENKKQRDRFAVIITKRCGKAYIRNRTKRYYREIIRKNRIYYPPYFDILVLPKSGIKKKDESNTSFIKIWLRKIKKK